MYGSPAVDVCAPGAAGPSAGGYAGQSPQGARRDRPRGAAARV